MQLFKDYKPSEKQLLFHQITNKTIKVLLCGVGFGKTTALIFELFKKMWIDYPCKEAIAAAPSYNLLRQGMFSTWEKFVPKSYYKFNQNTGEMILSNGSKIHWRTTSNPEYLRGISAVFVAYDEASVDLDNSAFSEFVARIRNTNPNITPQIAITTTPNGYNWIVDEFNDGPGLIVKEHSDGTKEQIVYKGTEDIWYNNQSIVIRARTFDNPFFPLESKYVQNLFNKPTATAEWIAQNVYAEFVSKEGIVFTEFKQDKNVIDLKTIKPKFRKYYAAFDFGFTAPSCLSIIGRTSDNKFVIVDEYYKNGLTWDKDGWFQIFQQAKAKYNLSTIICDSAHPERIAASNIHFNNSLIFCSSIKKQSEAIQRTQKLFQEQRLFISNNCINTIKQFQTWAWIKQKNGNLKDSPEGKGDHAIDTILYFFMSLSVDELSYSSFY